MFKYDIPSILPRYQSVGESKHAQAAVEIDVGGRQPQVRGGMRLAGTWNIVSVPSVPSHRPPGSFDVFHIRQLPLKLLSGLFPLLQRAVDLVQGLFDAQGRQPCRGVLVPALFHELDQSRESLREADDSEEQQEQRLMKSCLRRTLTGSENQRLGMNGLCCSTHTTFLMSSKLGSFGTWS